MGLDEQLNDIQPSLYKIFNGRYIDAMPALRADNRVPLTVRQIAEKRLEAVASENETEIEKWLNMYLDTPDAIAYSGDELKIISDCGILKKINSGAELKNGALVLTETQYKKLRGKTFHCSELKLDDGLTEQEAKEHPVWQTLLGDILEPYAKMIFSEGKKRRGFDKAMGVSPSDIQIIPTMQASCFYGMYNNSDINDCCEYLDNDSRLVGVCKVS